MKINQAETSKRMSSCDVARRLAQAGSSPARRDCPIGAEGAEIMTYIDDAIQRGEYLGMLETSGYSYKLWELYREDLDEDSDDTRPAYYLVGLDKGNVRRVEILIDSVAGRLSREVRQEVIEIVEDIERADPEHYWIGLLRNYV